MFEINKSFPETDHIFQLDVPGQSINGAVLKPWDERRRTSNQLQPLMQQAYAHVAGANVVAFQPPSLPGSNGLPLQFVVQSTDSFDKLNKLGRELLQEAQKSGMFFFIDTDLKIDKPQTSVEIDRDKTAGLGLTMNDVGTALSSMLGGGYVNYFSLYGRSYKVIPQVEQEFRFNADQLNNYYLRTKTGASVPLSTVAHLKTSIVPESLNHFQQQNSVTLQGVAAVPMGDAIQYLKTLGAKLLPPGYTVDFGGQSRQYVQESSGFIATFAFALIIIFLTLAAQFESFRDPLIILVSVPLSIAGALVFIVIGSNLPPGATALSSASLNIYTEVGLVTLMGLISKHGILLVEFANHLQEQGRSKRDAIEQAAAIRLRPILMTTCAMVLGVAPLLLASGAGAVSRFNMGLVISAGLTIGTFFTLFVVPAMYLALGADHHLRKMNATEVPFDAEAHGGV
jgi:multidrug efflux pump